MSASKAIVVGAGIGGLVAALVLASRGVEVLVVERASAPGGKMREVAVGEAQLDVGPTVFTMRWVFEHIFAEAGAALDDYVTLEKTELLARHAWDAEQQLDLFCDRRRTADAIAAFAGPLDARGYLDFSRRAERVYLTLRDAFMKTQRPSVFSLTRTAGLRGLGDLARISPFTTLWQALGEHFHDPRLRQLFARYATYCGSSPFRAPATLMLVAHVEQEGVWLVKGGMFRVAAALAALAQKHGARFLFGTEAASIRLEGGAVAGITLTSGERISSSAVVVNADTAAISSGQFGRAVSGAGTTIAPAQRSLSAMTFAMSATADDFPLSHHNVFFSENYRAEFEDLTCRRLPADPTVYICAPARSAARSRPAAAEPLFCLVNAPPDGDVHSYSQAEIDTCRQRMMARLERCGLRLREQAPPIATSPADFHRMFPATGGALYGAASHGWMASFRRPGARTRIPGLI